MKFIKKIREDILGLSKYEMSKQMGYNDTRSYISFENSKNAISMKRLIKIWEMSGLNAEEFLELVRKEVEEV